jgi:hypothetical protein
MQMMIVGSFGMLQTIVGYFGMLQMMGGNFGTLQMMMMVGYFGGCVLLQMTVPAH